MKRLLCFSILLCLPLMGLAMPGFFPRPRPLNTVQFQVQAEQWANTKTAKVLVNFNGTLSTADLGAVHANVMRNLNKLSSTPTWHVTRFQRSKDKSGLERVFVTAQARLLESQLARLRRLAKKISKPGATYKIADIQFTPSMKTIEAVRAVLRVNIYQQAKAELATLNQLYPKQKFQLHRIIFNPVRIASSQPRAMNMLVAKESFAAGPAPTMSVSRKVVMTARIEVAAKMACKKHIKGAAKRALQPILMPQAKL